MKRITISIALIFFAGLAFAQTASPKRPSTPAEQSAVIEKVREFALSYTKNLPNYTCVQLTRQMIMRDVFGKLTMAPPEVIEEQVSFVNNREIRKVSSINGKPVAADSPGQQRGTPSRGEFGNLLEAIFDPQASAGLRWDRAMMLDHRPVYVLAYRVPQARGYTLTEAKRTIQVPYQGLVYADPETFAVVRIEMKVSPNDIPKGSEYVNVVLTLDYKPAQVAGKEFVLPAHFSLHYQMVRGMAWYEAEYTNYRKFSADATIEFEGDKNQ
jgi:hypothetical protein